MWMAWSLALKRLGINGVCHDEEGDHMPYLLEKSQGVFKTRHLLKEPLHPQNYPNLVIQFMVTLKMPFKSHAKILPLPT